MGLGSYMGGFFGGKIFLLLEAFRWFAKVRGCNEAGGKSRSVGAWHGKNGCKHEATELTERTAGFFQATKLTKETGKWSNGPG
jgi:hypothetical protein